MYMLVKLIINFDLTRQIQKNQDLKKSSLNTSRLLRWKKQNVKGKNITI